MTYKKWLIIVLSLMLTFAALAVAVNFCVDHHAVRLSLFSEKKEIRKTVYPEGINLHIFHPELIFRNPDHYDSFLFGSSRVGVIDVSKISRSRFYNMSYSLALTSQHLAILKAFLQRGIKIKSVVIGLDEFCFSIPVAATQRHLVRVMHPDIGGPNRAELFDMYFFRKPDLKELTLWIDRVLMGKMDGRFIMNSEGINLGWREKDRVIEATGKPVFDFTVRKYEPISYGRKEMDQAFATIEELIVLSRAHHFSITFFINPFYSQLYLNNAEALSTIKKRLAQKTDYYDFSGFNSVTTNAMNYYEESHYRFRVGDMMIKRMFGDTSTEAPYDFGVLVTRKNIGLHLENQKRELEQYLKIQHLR